MSKRGDTRTVKYHTVEWGLLVELGWITMHVDCTGMAHMIYEGK